MYNKIRYNTFETNSSSTHSLTIKRYKDDFYLSESNKIIVEFIDTNDYISLTSLKEKVSYLVSLIVNRYKYVILNYKDLKEQVENCLDFIRIKNYVKETYNKDVILPENIELENVEDIVEINHQLYSTSLDETLQDLVSSNLDYLGMVLSPETNIRIGHD